MPVARWAGPVAALLLAAPQADGQDRIRPEALARWTFAGEGAVAVRADGGALVLTEVPGSKGVVLASPDPVGRDMVLTCQMQPLTPESVLVVLLAASTAPGERLQLPDDYDGGIDWIARRVRGYFFAFHNAAHAATPFVRRYPQKDGGRKTLAEAQRHFLDHRDWHDVEAGRAGRRLWLRLDDQLVLEAQDPDPHGIGHVAFRLRGTKERIGAVMIRGVRLRAGS